MRNLRNFSKWRAMVHCKTQSEIELMGQGGKILAQVLSTLLDHVKPGVSETDLDRMAERLIIEKGGEPGFKKVPGYRHTICVSTNDVVVHGIPKEYKFKEGDVVGIDCGVYYKGLHTDMAETVRVQGKGARVKKPDEVDTFLETGKKALDAAIQQAKIGNRVGHISKTIQDSVEKEGYSIVRSLVGHGVGRELHEEPEVPGFLEGSLNKTALLKEGMVLAVEVIYNEGDRELVLDDDGWTIKTKDASTSGLYERTVAITKNGPIVLTA